MDYMTTTEAAAELGVTRARIRQFIAEGRLPGARKAGRDWLIPRDALEPVRERKPGRPRSKG